MSMLETKNVLITGVASKRSIAWGIAQAMHREGAKIAFTCQNEKLKDRTLELAKECDSELVLACDMQSDDEINVAVDSIKNTMGSLYSVVHSVAYAPREALTGDYLENTSREGFSIAHEVSCYSLNALAKATRPLLQESQGSLLTLSYLGAERYIPNYNVMGVAKAALEANVRYLAACLGPDGIRVNGISAGPIKTLAAAGIDDFRQMLDLAKNNAPLRRNVTLEDIGNTAAFLCSPLANGITGEITHVDCGYNITGMVQANPEAEEN